MTTTNKIVFSTTIAVVLSIALRLFDIDNPFMIAFISGMVLTIVLMVVVIPDLHFFSKNKILNNTIFKFLTCSVFSFFIMCCVVFLSVYVAN